jgi:hypothetical protein
MLAAVLIFHPGPAASAPEVTKPACAASTEFTVVDLSRPVTDLRATDGKSGLSALKDFGVTAIFRYYDLPKESLGCKTLLPDEVDAILAASLSIGVVFQHNSDDPATFVADNAKAHAQRSLALAAANGQPAGSAIYFGVDGADLHLNDLARLYERRGGTPMSPQEQDELIKQRKRKLVVWYGNFLTYRHQAFAPDAKITAQSLYPFVKRYFDTVRSVFREHARAHPDQSYKVGMYCTGGVCEYAAKNSLADYYWVTAEGRNLPDYARFIDANRWHLLQQLPTSCPGWTTRDVGFDFNRVAPSGDFGAWSRRRPDRAPIDRPETCPGP